MNNFNIAVLATALGLLNQNCERQVIYDVIEREVITHKEIVNDNTSKPEPKPPKFKFPGIFHGKWEYNPNSKNIRITKDSIVHCFEYNDVWHKFEYSTLDYRDFKYKQSIKKILMEYKKNGDLVELQVSGDVISYKVFSLPSHVLMVSLRLNRKR